jgi:dihydrolipoamide dehydrogenase
MRMFDLIVIGGGPAGVTAAVRARELGATVALVERGNLGGTCTNSGCVPTRVLAKAARLVRDAEQFGAYGLLGEQPSVDFAQLLARTHQIVYQVHEKKQLQAHLEQAGVETFTRAGDARFVDEHRIMLADQTVLEGARFVICTGGHPRRLTFPGSDYALTHHDIWSMRQLPRELVVVGGAATGCQLASIFAAFGTCVSLLEAGPRLLSSEDSAVSVGLAEAFGRRGIQVVTGIGGLERIEEAGGTLRVLYRVGEQIQELHSDAIILAVGWPGNSEDLNLSAAHVKTEHGSILVDDQLRTSAPHIFAAGDITGRMMLVQSAGVEANIAAENALLGLNRKGTHAIVPHGGFTDPEYGSVGLTEDQARASHDCVVAVVPYSILDRALIDGRQEGFLKLLVSRISHQILGAHIVGEQAVELLHITAAALASHMPVEQLARLELAYPTFAAIVGIAARQITRELGGVALAPQWRTLGHPGLPEWERRAAIPSDGPME